MIFLTKWIFKISETNPTKTKKKWFFSSKKIWNKRALHLNTKGSTKDEYSIIFIHSTTRDMSDVGLTTNYTTSKLTSISFFW